MLVEERYVVKVRLNGYTNPSGECQGCDIIIDRTCCDVDLDFTTSGCIGERRCDSYFNYCLRRIGDKKPDCSPSERRNTSSINSNDGPLNFSQSRVLGLSNPQVLSGLKGAYQVSSYMI